jgi:hypothetical protein
VTVSLVQRWNKLVKEIQKLPLLEQQEFLKRLNEAVRPKSDQSLTSLSISPVMLARLERYTIRTALELDRAGETGDLAKVYDVGPASITKLGKALIKAGFKLRRWKRNI